MTAPTSGLTWWGRDGSLVAIQCKFFDADTSIQKRHIDSFLSASAKPEYAERLIVETTEVPWSASEETRNLREVRVAAS